jgi:ornithine cyclodeaminase
VRVSAGFYSNPEKGLPSNDGVTLVFSSLTGAPVAMLSDGGWLTGMRTALAGQIVAKALAPAHVTGIGIIGTGEQARLQLEQLMSVTPCRQLTVWGRRPEPLQHYRTFAQALGFEVVTTLDAREVALNSNLIITATPSRQAIIASEWIKPGTHITAVGADGPGKQELDRQLVARAGRIFVDSVQQCSQYGEVAGALQAGLIRETDLIELGKILAGISAGRQDDQQITLADLTGVAIQDTQIATCAMMFCEQRSSPPQAACT